MTGELIVTPPTNVFFQTNTAQAETLYFKILETAPLKPSDVVCDLFCGTGDMSLFTHPREKFAVGGVE